MQVEHFWLFEDYVIILSGIFDALQSGLHKNKLHDAWHSPMAGIRNNAETCCHREKLKSYIVEASGSFIYNWNRKHIGVCRGLNLGFFMPSMIATCSMRFQCKVNIYRLQDREHFIICRLGGKIENDSENKWSASCRWTAKNECRIAAN